MTKALLTLLSLLMLISCQTHFNTSQIFIDENMEDGIKQQIAQLDKQVIKALVDSHPKAISELCSEKLLAKSGGDVASIVEKMRGHLDISEYKREHQYLVKNSSENAATTINLDDDEKNGRALKFVASSKQTLVSINTFENKQHTMCILIVYGLYNDKWKIDALQIGETEVFEKDAIGWMKAAQDAYNKGAVVDAYNLISISEQMTNPLANYLHYNGHEDIKQLQEKIRSELNKKYTLPFTISGIATKPSIVRVTPLIINSGCYPLVSYVSTINASDTIALAKECDVINSQIGNIFHGMDSYNDTILYRVYDTIPTGNRSYKYYGFVRGTK